MAEQLALDLPGVTVTWADLRPGDRIRWWTPDGPPQPRIWRVDSMPKPSIWAQPGHAAHCPACNAPGPHQATGEPAADCTREPAPAHISVLLTDLSDSHVHGRGTCEVATDPVERISRGTADDWARWEEMQKAVQAFREQHQAWLRRRQALRLTEEATAGA